LSLKQSAFEIAIQNLRKDPEAGEIIEDLKEEFSEKTTA
jgi:hypothetical protein